MESGVSQSLGIFNTAHSIVGIAEVPDRDVERLQYRFGDQAALGLPGIFFAEVSTITDKHQQWYLVQKGQRHNRIDSREEAMILHQQCGIDAGQMCSS